MRFKGVIFDLDGTLLDTLDDIADAVNTVMKKQGFPTHGRVAVRSFVGSGLRSLMERSIPENERTEEMINQCFAEMMVVYRQNFRDKTVPYDGILELLNWMAGQNIPMAVFSNKADELSKGLIEAKLPYNFVAVKGMTSEELKKPNPAVALEIAATMGMKPEECLYVGDSDTDMKTANNAGMYALGVTWGFRERECLIRSGAKKLVDEPSQMIELFQ